MNHQPGLAKRVAFNTIVQFSGRISGAITAIIATRLITDHLGVAGYGRYTTIFAYTTFFGAIADFGFFWYLVREIAKDKLRAEKITANVITLRLLFAMLVLTLGTVAAYSVPSYDEVIRLGIIFLAISMLWVTLSNTLIGVFQANERMDFPVISEIIGRLAALLLTWYVVSKGYGLLPIVGAALTGSLVIFLLNLYFARRFVRLRLGFDVSEWKNIMRENTTLGINVLLGIIYFKIDAVMLSAMKPSLDVGIYGAPYKVLEILLAFPAMFMGAIFPEMAKQIKEDVVRARATMQKSFDLLAIASWGVVIGVITLAKPIISFTTRGGEEFVTAHTVTIGNLPITAPVTLQILAIAVGLAFLGNFFVSVIVAQGSQKQLIVSNAINAASNIGLNFIFIPAFSYFAAALTTIASETIMLAFSSRIVQRTTRFWPGLRTFSIAGICAGGMGLCLLPLRDDLPVLLASLVGSTIYVILLFATGCINKTTVQLLLRRSN